MESGFSDEYFSSSYHRNRCYFARNFELTDIYHRKSSLLLQPKVEFFVCSTIDRFLFPFLLYLTVMTSTLTR